MEKELSSKVTSLTVALIISLLFGLGLAMRAPMVPIFLKERGATPMQVGVIRATWMIGSLAFSVPFGILSDRIGRKKILIFGLITSGMAFAYLITLAHGFYQMVAVFVLGGLGSAASGPVMSAIIGDVTRGSEFGRSYGWYHTFLESPWIVGPSIASLIIGVTNYEILFICSSIPFLFAIIFTTTKIKSTNLTRAKAKKSEGKSVDVFKALCRKPVVVACWVAFFCLHFGAHAWSTFFPLYFNEIGLGVLVGYLFTIEALAKTFISPLTGSLSDKLRRRTPFMIIGLVLDIVMFALITLFPTFVPITFLITLFGLGLGMGIASVMASLAEYTDPNTRGLAMGIAGLCSSGGRAIGPIILGYVVEGYGYRTAFQTSAAVIGAGALVSLLFLGIQRFRI